MNADTVSIVISFFLLFSIVKTFITHILQRPSMNPRIRDSDGFVDRIHQPEHPEIKNGFLDESSYRRWAALWSAQQHHSQQKGVAASDMSAAITILQTSYYQVAVTYRINAIVVSGTIKHAPHRRKWQYGSFAVLFITL